jgi:hypothetical protein
MAHSPVLLFHIVAGTLAAPFGIAALVLPKTSRGHRAAGRWFVWVMIGLGLSGAYLGFAKNQLVNGLMGLFLLDLVLTASWTADGRAGSRSAWDWGALFVSVAVGTAFVVLGFAAVASPTGLVQGNPAAPHFVFGVFALLCAVGDLRMIRRGGLSGGRRIARHLWRMCFALFIAAASLFLVRAQLFPEILRRTHALVVLSFLPLVVMLFWLLRIRLTKAFGGFGRGRGSLVGRPLVASAALPAGARGPA